jgi:cytochrome b6-f complex iron-sulfur subunit
MVDIDHYGVNEVEAKMAQISRRGFLKFITQGLLALSGLLGLGGLVRFLSYEPEPPPPARVDVGPADSYPLNSRTVLPSVPALLVHTPEGFHAISLICTHLNCTVEVKPTELVCPCHGSQYDLDGCVTHGPAGKPLPELQVEVTADGKLVVLKG